jgi:hypothetical protein
MSMLERFILRLRAQRACLDAAAAILRADSGAPPGPILELGLGNGRSYDHLRRLLPEREIFAFERRPAPHLSCLPDPAHLIVGELEATLPGAFDLLPAPAALAHADLGTGDALHDDSLARFLAAALPPLLRCPGALVAADLPLAGIGFEPLQESCAGDGYFLYRCRA